MLEGLLGLIIFILDVIALIGVWSSGHSLGAKILWTVAIIALPVIGLILWYLLGARRTALA